MKTSQPPNITLLKAHRQAILALVAQYGGSNVRVIGSVAHGTATHHSDIDLLITLSPKPSVFELVELWQRLQALIGYPISIIPDDSNAPFVQSVIQDAIAL